MKLLTGALAHLKTKSLILVVLSDFDGKLFFLFFSASASSVVAIVVLTGLP